MGIARGYTRNFLHSLHYRLASYVRGDIARDAAVGRRRKSNVPPLLQTHAPMDPSNMQFIYSCRWDIIRRRVWGFLLSPAFTPAMSSERTKMYHTRVHTDPFSFYNVIIIMYIPHREPLRIYYNYASVKLCTIFASCKYIVNGFSLYFLLNSCVECLLCEPSHLPQNLRQIIIIYIIHIIYHINGRLMYPK